MLLLGKGLYHLCIVGLQSLDLSSSLCATLLHLSNLFLQFRHHHVVGRILFTRNSCNLATQTADLLFEQLNTTFKGVLAATELFVCSLNNGQFLQDELVLICHRGGQSSGSSGSLSTGIGRC